ncbi:MAG: hypothetical protein Q8O13_10560 [Candidatus Omnitrophota bacterium]|nr:hypothetical protein [Candidatus Omnitrophota bacterium]
MKRSGYAISTFVFNFFELGVFIHVLLHWGLAEAMIVGLLCKIGKALHESVHIGTSRQWAFCLIGVLGITAVFSGYFVVICIASVVIDVALMKLRMLYKKRLATWKIQKVFVRMLAFFLAPFFEFWLLALFIVFLIIDLITCDGQEREEFPGIFFPQGKKFITQYLMMFLHHAHYFSYCYAIPFLLIRRFNLPLIWVGVLFFAGWSAYNIYEPFISSSYQRFIIGHIIAIIGVGMIWIFYDSIFLVMVGWVVTGLGGGTVYMIKGLMKGSKSIHTSSSKAVESYGHVMGLLVSLFAVTSHNFGIMYVSSIFFATATVLISLFAIQKEGRIYVRD